MRIKPDQLTSHLAKGLKPLYCVYGDEPLLVLETADQIRQAGRSQGYGEREIYQVEGRFNWQTLLSAGDTLSLFSDRRLVDIRIPSGKPGLDGGKALQSYCASLPADTLTLITLPKLDRQATAAKWFSALDSAGVTIAVFPVGNEQLPRWIGERLIQQQQQADMDTLRFLAQKVEGNLLAAQQEIRKLALLFPTGKLDFTSVRDAVMDVARYDVFKLADALLMSDIPRLMRMFDGLRNEGEAPTLILWTLTRELRIMMKLKIAQKSGISSARMMREIGVWENRQPLLEKALQRIQLDTLTQGLRQAAAVDRMIKGLINEDPWPALKQLALSVALPPH